MYQSVNSRLLRMRFAKRCEPLRLIKDEIRGRCTMSTPIPMMPMEKCTGLLLSYKTDNVELEEVSPNQEGNIVKTIDRDL